MISIEAINLQRGGRVLLEDSSLTIHSGQHIGVTGANGTGKTSLFKVLLQELHVEAGNVRIPARLNIAHMAQEFDFEEISAKERTSQGGKTIVVRSGRRHKSATCPKVQLELTMITLGARPHSQYSQANAL